MKPEEVVDKQLEYYNGNLLDAFCSTYANEIQIIDLATGNILLSGKAELYSKYKYRFSVQKVKTKITNRIIIGNKVVDQEEVSGIKANEVVKAVAIYEVEDNLIQKVSFIFE